MKIYIKKYLVIVLMMPLLASAQRNLVHPGISHNLADLDRMKAMVQAGKEPWVTTYNNLRGEGTASFDYNVNGDLSITTIDGADGGFLSDGYAAYYNALMWYITEDERHAEKCVEIFNSWVNLTNTTGIPLSQGRGPWRLLEGAEIIKHTYDGWSSEDQAKFSAMLVYPGYSTTTVPSGNTTFYWGIYQGDRERHGNQGLFAYRSLMAMGVFMDNEVMYERALRYLQGLPHRSDDLAYPSGPPQTTPLTTGCEYYDEFSIVGHGSTVDYGYNELIENYIWESGQSQESSRDQAHALAGVSIISCIAEIAWNQGDDLYGFLDNRLLKGWEYYYRYNLSYQNKYSDQQEPWEPTVESEEFIERLDRSGRWKSLKINPWLGCSQDRFERGNKHMLEPIYEQNLGHYKDRLLLDPDEYKWLNRGFELLKDSIGLEDGRRPGDHAGWGGLKFRRVSPGDPIEGFDANGLPNYAMNTFPKIIEAEDFDYFVADGEGRVYNDASDGNLGGEYRTDEDVDIKICSEGGYSVTSIEDGEYLNYTVGAPGPGSYSIKIRYSAENSSGKIGFSIDGENLTGDVQVPSTGSFDTWADLVVSNSVFIGAGVHELRVGFSGESSSFELNNISVDVVSISEVGNLALSGTASQSSTDFEGVASRAIDGNTDRAWGGGSVTHTLHDEAEKWWQVDLGEEKFVESVTVFGRSENAERVSDLTIDVLDSDGTIVLSEFFPGFPNPSITMSTGGVVGQMVRVSKTSEFALMLAEVQVFGYDIPKSGQTITFDPLLGKGVEDPDFSPNATASSGLEVTYTSSNENVAVVVGGNIDIVGVGTTEITASQAGNDFYISATNVTQTLIVSSTNSADKQDQTISFDSFPSKQVGDADFSAGATASSGLALLYSSSNLVVATIVDGQIRILGAGTTTITALQLGDETFNPVSSSQELTVGKVEQTITFNALTVKEVGDDNFSPGATSSSGLAVSYSSSDESVATVLNGNIHLLDAGTTTITAFQLGNASYLAAVAITQELVVKYGQTIIFESLPVKAEGDSDFSPGATSDSELPITYTSSATEVATIVDGNIHIVSSGISVITASQAGDGIYNAAVDVTQTLAITPGTALSTVANLEGISLHPNPVFDILKVDFEDDSYDEYMIYNINGQIVKSGVIEKGAVELEIDFEGLSKGLYMLKINGSMLTKSFKVVKN